LSGSSAKLDLRRTSAGVMLPVRRWLKLPPSAVSVAQGGKSRMKQILVEGDPETLTRLIEARLFALTG
jgi:uncharacterized protein YggU (UPF0235/DUF167 family)